MYTTCDEHLIGIVEEITDLLYRRLNDDLNAAEQQYLMEWLYSQEPAVREEIERMTEWPVILKGLREYYSFDTEAAYRDVWQRICQESAESKDSYA